MHSPVDPRFPRIAIAFDTDRMRSELERAFHGLSIVRCSIEETLYRPGRSCMLVYRVEVESSALPSRAQLVTARVCRQGESGAEFARAMADAPLDLGDPPALACNPGLDMVFWLFPNDPVLRSLPAMLDADFMRSLLPHRLTALDLRGANRLADVDVEVLHYRAERTCMLRYRLHIEHRASGRRETVVIYGKAHGGTAGLAAYDAMRQLADEHPQLATAIALGFDADLNAVWQSHVHGDSIEFEHATPRQMLDAMERIARCVAAFHSSALEGTRNVTTSEILSQLDKTAKSVAWTIPRYKERLSDLVDHLRERARQIDFSEAPCTPVHRDLKLANFLRTTERAALVDLDEVSLGDPLFDIGSFLATFHSRALAMHWDELAAVKVEECFLAHYANAVSWPIERERLEWYVAACLVHEGIHRAVRQWDAEKLRNIPCWIALAERYAYRNRVSDPSNLAAGA